ncbi:hypothetical protein [Breznakiella homolactica]|uniref:Lipocalin-like domain-containing protein n=1 Tax=Breznakiella homolactica TaxID=2798577 RepID=A0A7T8BBK4_9SPIR|nr:hypothetical protein [Breznakiella homolactica]QQO10145.1 hypothetical protein JFL75_04285 [Breznakiella homolactica]
MYTARSLFKKLPALLFVLLLAAGLSFFTACDNGTTSEGATLIGSWQANGSYGEEGNKTSFTEVYTITNDTLTYSYEEGSVWDYTFTGSIKNNPDFTNDYGVIIIEYLAPSDPSLKFSGTYWRGLTETSVSMANAANLDNYREPVETATLEEALAKFTIDNIDDFVNWSNIAPLGKID